MSKKIFVIAEAGVNHNGNLDIALQLVDVASESGADAIKFQTFDTSELVTTSAPKALYQTANLGIDLSQFDMLKNLELSKNSHRVLKQHTEERGLVFMSTAFDIPSLKFLVHDLGISCLKIPSGEVTNGPLLFEYGKTDRELIISTGMASIEEIRWALGVIAHASMKPDESPSNTEFLDSFYSEQGQELLSNRVTLLHCTSEYPAPVEQLNLLAIETLRKTFGLKVGYSDHSEGIFAAVAAAALGSVVIEKHFTLDKDLEGPDHRASLGPEELCQMVNEIRKIESGLGDGIKKPTTSELVTQQAVRKSLYARIPIKAGELFTEHNLTTKRPQSGISPMEYWRILGTVSRISYAKDEQIR